MTEKKKERFGQVLGSGDSAPWTWKVKDQTPSRVLNLLGSEPRDQRGERIIDRKDEPNL